MVLDHLPPISLTKHLRGLIDIYVLRIGGVDKVIARAWPSKGAGYKTVAFKKSSNSASLTLQAYRSLSDLVRLLGNSYHKNLGDTFLDHFRAGYQHHTYLLQALAPYFTRIEMSDTISPPDISIRFFRPFPCQLFVNHRQPARICYHEQVTNYSRGIPCTKYYYLRPLEGFLNSPSDFAVGWTPWINSHLNCELEVFCSLPNVANPQVPWFGPYPIESLWERFCRLI